MNQQEHLTALAEVIRSEISQGHPVHLQEPEEVDFLMCLSPGELYNFGRNCHAQIVPRNQDHAFDFYDCSASLTPPQGTDSRVGPRL